MNTKQFLSILLLAGLLFPACGEEGGDTGPDNPSPDSGAIAAALTESAVEAPDPDAIYLERMYATSTGTQQVGNLLDGDAESYWNAMPGAGVDEGVMLYFEEPVLIEKVRILGPGGASSIQELAVYANGSEAGRCAVGGEVDLASEVQSLYLRILSVPNTLETREGEDESYRILTTYPADLEVRLSELEIYGEGGEKLKVRPLKLLPGTIKASSVLEPKEAYSEDYLFDSRLEFGWAEGQEHDGIGESVIFSFDQEVRIEKLKVWNGYQRSEDHFKKNGRWMEFSFGVQGGDAKSYRLPDQMAPEVVDLGTALEGKSFVMEVKGNYAGSRYKDLLLSELRFHDGQRWFGLESKGEGARKKALQERVAGTILEELLDRNITYHEYADINEKTDLTERVIFRSNGSFVIYKDFNGNIDNTVKDLKEVADGNWEIQSLGKQEAKVKIFGKLHRIMDKDLVYKGTKAKVGTRIFSEIITITPEIITGDGFLWAIYRKTSE